MLKKNVNDYFKKYSYNTRHRKQKWKRQINNLEQIKGQCYLPMSSHFLNQIGTEATTLNQMLPGVVHMQGEVWGLWALYNYSERFEFFFFLVHMQSPMRVTESSSLWFVSIFCLIYNWVLKLVDHGLSLKNERSFGYVCGCLTLSQGIWVNIFLGLNLLFLCFIEDLWATL